MRKNKFLCDEFWMLAWNASVQHVGVVYKGQSSKSARRKFREDLRSFVCQETVPQYKAGVSEEQHYQHIKALIVRAQECDAKVLNKDVYKYASAQKLLNLTLKYWWCEGWIAEPPHCPLDSTVFEKAKIEDPKNWTEIETKKEYCKAIEAVKKKADSAGKTIAQWELEIYTTTGYRYDCDPNCPLIR